MDELSKYQPGKMFDKCQPVLLLEHYPLVKPMKKWQLWWYKIKRWWNRKVK